MKITARIFGALRQNFLPGIVLQAFALLLVAGFYFVPSIHDFCQGIGRLKVEYGYVFSALSTSFFGGVLPFCFLRARGKIPAGQIRRAG
jgi:hypothetical protein